MEDLVKELTIDMVPERRQPHHRRRRSASRNYYKLCSVVGGSTIYLQKPESVLRPVRDAHIKAEFNGYNNPELARKYGVTERWVRQLCGEGKLEGQMSLLDYGDEPENTTF
jgi:Mor family transcriptional regulator